jgi:RNA polymerase sigma-32 factor
MAAAEQPIEPGLARYLSRIRSMPMLSPDREVELARSWVETRSPAAADEIISAHLRLAAKIAMSHRKYGVPLGDLISEANAGLVKALDRFDPEKGFRFSTFAQWWCRSEVQAYILRARYLVKPGGSHGHKKLFFKLRQEKARLGIIDAEDLHPDNVARIARSLGVREDEVVFMDRRLSASDASLNAPLAADGEEGAERIDMLADEGADHGAEIVERSEYLARKALLDLALDDLKPRERHILQERRLTDPPSTLAELACVYEVSRERIRQIENKAFDKLSRRIRQLAAEKASPRPGRGRPGGGEGAAAEPRRGAGLEREDGPAEPADEVDFAPA